MIHSLFAYLLAAMFFAVERALRRGAEARTLEAGPADQGTTRLLGAGYGLALNAGILLPVLGIGRVDRVRQRSLSSAVGFATMVAGLLLKAWAMRTLGRFYTRTLRVTGDQHVVHTGPYRLVRHPGYLAALLVWIGFGLALANWVVTLTTAATLLAGYHRRMVAEEAMLVELLGDRYRAYMRRTWRLLPGLY